MTTTEAAANALVDMADDTQFFQICVNGKPISFYGVRTYKTIGSAKGAISNHFKYVLKGYRKTDKNYETLIKEFGLENLKYDEQESAIKIAVKKLTKMLVDSGVVTFEEI